MALHSPKAIEKNAESMLSLSDKIAIVVIVSPYTLALPHFEQYQSYVWAGFGILTVLGIVLRFSALYLFGMLDESGYYSKRD